MSEKKAKDVKKTSRRKRVTADEDTKRDKRDEKTARPKRAKPEKQTKQDERAMASKKPTPVERAPSADNPMSYTLAIHYQTIQKVRVAMKASLKAHAAVADARARHIVDQLVTLEKEVVSYLTDVVENHPVCPWLFENTPLRFRLGAMLFCLVDIKRARTVSALWRYAGLAVIDGAAERRKRGVVDEKTGQRKKGEKIHFNMRLKKTAFLISRQLILANKGKGTEPYISIYRKAKERYMKKYTAELAERKKMKPKDRPKKMTWSRLRVDLTARRIMVKVFLQHLWVVWRTTEGLPVNEPYVEAFKGHTGIVPVPGWNDGRQTS